MKSQTSSRKAEKQPQVLPAHQHATAASLVKPARQLRSSSEELHERITLRAYELYAQRGWREDHALDDWLDAEREILGLHIV
jgi:Protein of unknown function (DUF2934)